MNTQELKRRLNAEGCNSGLYIVGKPWAVTDVYCLTQVGRMWQVYYTERGQNAPPIFESPDEAAACAFYFDLIMGLQHNHCVAVLRQKTAVHTLQALLTQHNIPSHTDKIPYGGWDDPRYRVFVTGKAIFAAKVVLGNVPIQD